MTNGHELSPPRLPEALKAHAVWTSTDGPDRRRAVYVTERARRKISIIAMLVLLPTMGSTMIWGPSSVQYWAAGALVIGALFLLKYQGTGRAGFYQLNGDGTLGDFLGRQSPDLSDMQRTRVS
jgi:hypothetical protein